jgi:hypothetical protein
VRIQEKIQSVIAHVHKSKTEPVVTARRGASHQIRSD